MKKIVAATLFLTAVPAIAADDGVYIGAMLGRASVNNTLGATALTNTKNSVFGGLLGYQFNRNFGVEAQYTGAGKFQSATATGKTDAFSLTAVGTAPLTDVFSLYGKLGVANTKSKITDTNVNGLAGASRTAATFGLGAQMNVTPALGVRLGWDRYGSAATNAGVKTNFNSNVWGIGAVYKF